MNTCSNPLCKVDNPNWPTPTLLTQPKSTQHFGEYLLFEDSASDSDSLIVPFYSKIEGVAKNILCLYHNQSKEFIPYPFPFHDKSIVLVNNELKLRKLRLLSVQELDQHINQMNLPIDWRTHSEYQLLLLLPDMNKVFSNTFNITPPPLRI